jgi:hypothetical protein
MISAPGRRTGRLAIGSVVLGSIWASACSDDDGPRLEAAMPAAAMRDARVDLIGRRLCGAAGACASAAGEVQIGIEPPTVRAVVVGYADTSAQIVIPSVAPIGATVLIVTVNERSSNALAFEVLP